MKKKRLKMDAKNQKLSPRYIEIPGWCLVASVLPHGEKVPLALVGHPFSYDIRIKIPYGFDIL